eukprot:161033-Pelagomonas_calceolata.AAC.2
MCCSLWGALNEAFGRVSWSRAETQDITLCNLPSCPCFPIATILGAKMFHGRQNHTLLQQQPNSYLTDRKRWAKAISSACSGVPAGMRSLLEWKAPSSSC